MIDRKVERQDDGAPQESPAPEAARRDQRLPERAVIENVHEKR